MHLDYSVVRIRRCCHRCWYCTQCVAYNAVAHAGTAGWRRTVKKYGMAKQFEQGSAAVSRVTLRIPEVTQLNGDYIASGTYKIHCNRPTGHQTNYVKTVLLRPSLYPPQAAAKPISCCTPSRVNHRISKQALDRFISSNRVELLLVVEQNYTAAERSISNNGDLLLLFCFTSRLLFNSTSFSAEAIHCCIRRTYE